MSDNPRKWTTEKLHNMIAACEKELENRRPPPPGLDPNQQSLPLTEDDEENSSCET